MTPEQIVSFATILATVVLSAAFLLTVYRVVVGPTLPDRIVALDMLVGIAIGFIALIAIRTGFDLYVDIAIALGLVGFLATVAFARFVLSRGADGRRGTKAVLDGERASEAPEKLMKTGQKRGKRRGGR
ncbi:MULTISPECIES: cation:proton antiporter [unclassified Rhizobium]|uniref:cation:proton antiporter n=1 Tax=unclassified Rhizobium TaxID=2613769 RepID=UPI0024788971|nr:MULTISPECIES: cation:proton antiporter [unclassified Rhizobium]MDH7800213.1 multicomponent Na+:H+ antiporter subunit F [Rhizobium sp. AN70]